MFDMTICSASSHPGYAAYGTLKFDMRAMCIDQDNVEAHAALYINSAR
jgi:hypothetical protein